MKIKLQRISIFFRKKNDVTWKSAIGSGIKKAWNGPWGENRIGIITCYPQLARPHSFRIPNLQNILYYINTNEILGFFLFLKNHAQWGYYFYLSSVRILVSPWLLKRILLLWLHNPLKRTWMCHCMSEKSSVLLRKFWQSSETSFRIIFGKDCLAFALNMLNRNNTKAACRYGSSILLFNLISHEWALRTSEMHDYLWMWVVRCLGIRAAWRPFSWQRR